jgi:hypothetical protein
MLFAYYLVFSVGIMLISLVKPMLNGDIIPYVGSAKSYETRNAIAIHEFTQKETEAVIPKTVLKKLISTDDGDNNLVLENPEQFFKLLNLYRIRVAYTGMIWLLSQMGINAATASYLISAVCVSIGLIVLYWIAKLHLDIALAYLLPPFGMVCGMLTLARLSTPDGMAFLGVMICIFLNLQGCRMGLYALPSLVLIRTDLLFFAIALIFFTFLSDRTIKNDAIFSASASIFLFILLNHYMEYPGWAAIFSISLLPGRGLYGPFEVTLSDYAMAAWSGLKSAIEDKSFLLYLIGIGSILYIRRDSFFDDLKNKEMSARYLRIILSSISFVSIHFIIFPAIWERHFVHQYLIGILSIMALLSNKTRIQYERML